MSDTRDEMLRREEEGRSMNEADVHNAEAEEKGWRESWTSLLTENAKLREENERLRYEEETGMLVLNNLREANERLNARLALLEAVADHLRWTLPMAKGYAAEHPVGNNARMVVAAYECLEDIDAAIESGKGTP